MSGLTSIFTSVHDNVPLHELNIIEIGFNPRNPDVDDIIPEGYDARLINFQHILETGEIQSVSHDDGSIHYEDDAEKFTYTEVYDDDTGEIVYESPHEWRYDDMGPGHEDMEGVWGSQYVSWESNDPFIQSIDTIKENSLARIQESPELKELLEKDSWDINDREIWEGSVSQIISEEVDKIPGLDTYRNNEDLTIDRAKFLNDISTDIAYPEDVWIEVDCETYTLIEGSVIQDLENRMLPETAAVDDFKTSSNYFYAVGKVSYNMSDEALGHAYIVSSATGNVIEATSDPSYEGIASISYLVNSNPDYSFEDIVRGQPIVTEDFSVYGGDDLDLTLANDMRGYISYEEVFNQLDTSQIGADHAPEVQALSEIKQMIETSDIDDPNSNQCSLLQNKFNETVEELIESGGIYEVMKYIEAEGYKASSSEQDANIENDDSNNPTADQDVTCTPQPMLVI